MSIYQLRRDADGIILVYNAAGQQVIKLEGGSSDLILATYMNLCRYENRGDDYLSGVIQGVVHCTVLRPDLFSPLPQVPDIGPDLHDY